MAALQHFRHSLKGNVGHRLTRLLRQQHDPLRVNNALSSACAQNDMAPSFSSVQRQDLNSMHIRTFSSVAAGEEPSGSSGIGISGEATYKKAARTVPSAPSYANPFDPRLVEKLLNNMEGDLPLPEMPDPFEKEYHRCFLCRHNIQIDHKNVRLLSQFVSPYTGRIYGRKITGLCIPMQKRVAQLIKRARSSGFMPTIMKDYKYLHDPQPYDPMSKRK